MAPDIRFPHLGIEIASLGKGITIGGFTIAFYGMIIAFGMVMGYLMTAFQAKRTGQEPDLYLDLALWDIVFAVIGARIYYVVFSWDYYKDNLMQIITTRGGGIAIYGGVIAGVITTIIFGKVRKQNFFQLLDTACIGLITGQIIGRWGNFCNREAFGGYTNGLFAMQLKQSDVAASNLTHSVLKHAVEIDGTRYIQVHPTFLYESFWNIGVLIILLLFTKHRKYNGQIFLIYLLGYGLGRAWIEGLRTDQLIFFGTGVAVSQVLSGGLVVASAAILIYRFVKDRQKAKSAQ